MSAFKPQSRKTEDLPHLSNIERKPEPLGTEIKVCADSTTSITLYLEIQKGKEAMEHIEFTDITHKKTAACSKRLAKYSSSYFKEDEDIDLDCKETWLGDAWFASIETAIQVHNYGHFIGPVKGSHALYPKMGL